MKNKKTRRTFCKDAAKIMAGAGMISAFPGITACSNRSANDKMSIGLVGGRNMGWSNLNQFLKNDDVQLAGFCDIDDRIITKRLGDLEKMGVPKPDVYKDFRKLLERKDLDAVILGTPDHWHAHQMIMACDAGLDVYVEKPMGSTIEECEAMVKAKNKYKKVVQVGQWQRSGPHWHDVVEFIQSGKLGKIYHIDVWRYGGNQVPLVPDSPVPQGVDYDMWLGPVTHRAFNKNRFHYNFRWFWDYAGGKMTDWGVHLIDMAVWAMGVKEPNSVQATGGKFAFPDDAQETPDTMKVNYQFKDFTLTWKQNMALQKWHKDMDHGLAFFGENGVLYANRMFWMVEPIMENGGPKMQAVEKRSCTGTDMVLHVRNFIDCVKSRKSTAANVEIARDVAKVCHLGNIAYRSGEKILWNHDTQDSNNSKANSLLKKNYVDQWTLPR